MKHVFKTVFSGRSSKRVLSVAAVLGLTTASAFADPVALVLDKSENVGVAAFSELMPGAVVELGDGHIDLLDYGACQEVRLTSGVLTVSSGGYTLDGGNEKVLRAGNCLQADSGTDVDADKGLTVTLRGLNLENKKAASLMLRFDDKLRDQYDTVFVSFEGGAPKRFDFDVLDNILTDMPDRESDEEAVEVELFLQGKAPDFGVVMRKFTIDPDQVGRKTAVVIVK